MILCRFHDVEANEFGMIELCRGKMKRGLWAISPLKCKKGPSKFKKEPLKIVIDCNVKAF